MCRAHWGARVVVALGMLLTGQATVRAHMRDYLVNQSYYTASRNEFEVELWSDVNFADTDDHESWSFKQQVELEYGLTDHLQLAYYEVYTWDQAKSWERDQFKLEAKLRLMEAGQWPVDVALYSEYKNPDGSRNLHSDEVENKLILSRDFGPWNVIANLVAERKVSTHSFWEFEYTAGVSYLLSPRTRVGLEVKESLGDEHEFGIRGQRHPLYLVPGLYTNLTDHIRILVGPAFGLTRVSDDLQLKSIVEIEF